MPYHSLTSLISTTAPISPELKKAARQIGADISKKLSTNKQPEQSFVEKMQSTTPKGSREI